MQGIAVGIATKIPPHNLREVVAALEALVKQPDISPEELRRYTPAPDFPTGVQAPPCFASQYLLMGSMSSFRLSWSHTISCADICKRCSVGAVGR
jgi:hypothetical protein